MTNKETQDITGTGMYITLPSALTYRFMVMSITLPKQLELFPELDDPEPERYYDWMLWKMRQEREKDEAD